MGKGPCKHQPEPLAGKTCKRSVSKPGSGDDRDKDRPRFLSLLLETPQPSVPCELKTLQAVAACP